LLRDSVDWDDEQEAIALACVEKQASNPVEDDLRDLYNAEPASFWDAFYANNKGTPSLDEYCSRLTRRDAERFFNDRAWLRTEFPELAEAVKAGVRPVLKLERLRRLTSLSCRLARSELSRSDAVLGILCIPSSWRARIQSCSYTDSTTRKRPSHSSR
jgi:hypothetical protein